ncbi:uncharacterized protein B0I36DRAFT_320949 [Microdochium trichocladiopsis]|uniref:Uncharacterized protein n=1 Tax=Microdochium trichocladiopsis TaxID=1682393 RepID=A0A9P8YBB3_9PEZI|nr:uncharacterized protein B0I36DRAFT_320949 [Microdochium trichocladiopsis]KAH7033194.1 hypothetical protein B0I36DRAFT_320949 [Microdochium trichocladiopsis]
MRSLHAVIHMQGGIYSGQTVAWFMSLELRVASNCHGLMCEMATVIVLWADHCVCT